MFSGIVTRTDGPQIWVQANNEEFACGLRGRIKKEWLRVTSLVVIGDSVTVERLADGTNMITSIEPRRSVLSRPGFHGYVHIIAANVDQVVIVQAARQPNFKVHLVERFMALARRGHINAVVVVNKCDLESESVVQSWIAPLEHAGVKVFLTSASNGRGIAELRAQLQGRISVFAGQSGVGKSSLVNALYPKASIKTATVSEATSKGRHTTTTSRLYALPDGGWLADTPGIRSLAMFDDEEDDAGLAEIFPEVAEVALGCKFRDCTHSHEPGCAVKVAVACGKIAQDRYRNFLRLNGVSK